MPQQIVIIKELNHPERDASVQLVSIGGREYVLKTDTPREIAAQKFLNSQLKANGLPTLEVASPVSLTPHQILLEYVQGSLTLGQHLDEDTCREWGALVARMHAVTTPTFTVLDGSGRQIEASWHDYLADYIHTAVERHCTRKYSFDDALIGNIKKILQTLLDNYIPTEFSLVHGDLHVHNVLLKGRELILYDKFADFLVAPAAFDLGVIYAEAFAGAAYPELEFRTVTQQKLFSAFQDGYGPLPPEQQKWLDYFALLRAFYRWPNRFAPHTGEVIRLLVDRLKT